MSGILPPSFNDFFSWKTYESLPKSAHGTDVFFFGGGPMRHKLYCAWHLPPQSVYPHTRRYRLMRAICEKDINEVKSIIDEGFDINNLPVDGRYNYKSMGLAAALNRVGMLEYFLLRGGDINTQDNNGNTPLMHAVINWQYDAIKFLVENGADLNMRDKHGFTVLEKARFRGLASIVTYLEQQKTIKRSPKFPKFTVEFDFESNFSDISSDLYLKKKFYDPKPKVYPFNNLDGIYAIKFINFS